MSTECTRVPADTAPPAIAADGCEDRLAAGRRDWVHLRFCRECGHVGCCDNSPGRHAPAHFAAEAHPLIRSFEPGEDWWWWCYVDESFFRIAGVDAPSYR